MASARRGEQGQTVVLIVVFMFVLLGMCAMAIDVGIWYQDKRAVQASADAAALAGASLLPASWASAQTAATGVFNANKKAGDTATIANASNLTSNDSVKVTVTRTQPSFFAKLLGKNNITIQASARATVESVTTLAPSFDVMPWGVPQNDYVFSHEYSLYTNSPNNANNGALSLPYQSGLNCPVPNGANPYRDEIAGVLNPCSIPLGEVLDEKTGNNTGPTAQGLNTRITTWKPFNQIVEPVPGGANDTYTIKDNSTRQLVLVPIVTNLQGGNTWPHNAPFQVRVVGFAWFVIESCGPVDNPSYCSNSDGYQVNGRFVRLEDTDPGNSLGGYDPNSGTNYQIELTA
jgi:Flp pilus assembly protein TadG